MSRRAFAVAAIVLATSSARAQTDQLECFKVKDARRKAVVNALLQGIAPPHGCTIKVPAQLVCLPTVRPTGLPSPATGAPTGQNVSPFLCYELKCEPGAVLPSLAVGDMFGDRRVKPGRSRLFCTPLPTLDGVDGSTTTTTTTTLPDTCPCPTTTSEPGTTLTPTTATTTLPPPQPACAAPNTTCGSCGNGACQPTRPEGFFVCTFQTQGFCEGSCHSSAECPDGKFCVGASGASGQCCTPCF